METKVCAKRHRQLPMSEFYKCRASSTGYYSYCKECVKKRNRKRAERTDVETTNLNPKAYHDERFKDVTPRELMDELRARGYRGQLEFIETKIHRIKV